VSQGVAVCLDGKEEGEEEGMRKDDCGRSKDLHIYASSSIDPPRYLATGLGASFGRVGEGTAQRRVSLDQSI
jgi:hypothetical protein